MFHFLFELLWPIIELFGFAYEADERLEARGAVVGCLVIVLAALAASFGIFWLTRNG